MHGRAIRFHKASGAADVEAFEGHVAEDLLQAQGLEAPGAAHRQRVAETLPGLPVNDSGDLHAARRPQNLRHRPCSIGLSHECKTHRGRLMSIGGDLESASRMSVKRTSDVDPSLKRTNARLPQRSSTTPSQHTLCHVPYLSLTSWSKVAVGGTGS